LIGCANNGNGAKAKQSAKAVSPIAHGGSNRIASRFPFSHSGALVMTVERKLRCVRRRLEGLRLYTGLSGMFHPLATVARLERIEWRLQRVLERKRSAA
jgi:hypothetical protein